MNGTYGGLNEDQCSIHVGWMFLSPAGGKGKKGGKKNAKAAKAAEAAAKAAADALERKMTFASKAVQVCMPQVRLHAMQYSVNCYQVGLSSEQLPFRTFFCSRPACWLQTHMLVITVPSLSAPDMFFFVWLAVAVPDAAVSGH